MLKKMWSDGLNALPTYFNDYETMHFCFDDDGGDSGGGGFTQDADQNLSNALAMNEALTGEVNTGVLADIASRQEPTPSAPEQQYDDYAYGDFTGYLEPSESKVDEMMFGPEAGGRLGFWDGLTGGTYDGVASQSPAYGWGETAGDVAIGALTGFATGGPAGMLAGGARGALTGPAIRGGLEGEKAYGGGYIPDTAPSYDVPSRAFGGDDGGDVRSRARATTYLSSPYQKETRGSLTGGPQINSWAQWGASRG